MTRLFTERSIFAVNSILYYTHIHTCTTFYIYGNGIYNEIYVCTNMLYNAIYVYKYLRAIIIFFIENISNIYMRIGKAHINYPTIMNIH